jgi:hypothetical protein
VTAWVVVAGILAGAVVGVFGTLAYLAWKWRDML